MQLLVGLAGVALLPLASLGLADATTASTLDSSGDPVIAAAGDIACVPGAIAKATVCQQAGTASLLAGADKVLSLGDNQYESGAFVEYMGSYDPTWGQQKPITSPVPGNHEYKTTGAQGYFDYFGAAAGGQGQGYYSYDVGTWHLIALNSGSRSAVPTKQGSPQNTWLEQDLAAHPYQCILAYWHHPLSSAGRYSLGFSRVAGPIWTDLLNAHADLVLNGHDHNYQRWAPMDGAGNLSPSGIRQFIAGTGGKSHYALTTAPAGLEAAQGTAFGVLKLTLRAGSYDWQYVQQDGTVFDSGSAACV